MTFTDPMSDMLTRIRNGQAARLDEVVSPASSDRVNVLDVLKRQGYINGYEEKEERDGVKNLYIALKYYEGRPVISKIERVSTPGRRVYSKMAKMPRVHNGLGILILSTPKGVMSDSEARAENVGGEIICKVF